MGWIIVIVVLTVCAVLCIMIGLALCKAAKTADQQIEEYYNELRLSQ